MNYSLGLFHYGGHDKKRDAKKILHHSGFSPLWGSYQIVAFEMSMSEGKIVNKEQ